MSANPSHENLILIIINSQILLVLVQNSLILLGCVFLPHPPLASYPVAATTTAVSLEKPEDSCVFKIASLMGKEISDWRKKASSSVRGTHLLECILFLALFVPYFEIKLLTLLKRKDRQQFRSITASARKRSRSHRSPLSHLLCAA